jgi:hypothetical protein
MLDLFQPEEPVPAAQTNRFWKAGVLCNTPFDEHVTHVTPALPELRIADEDRAGRYYGNWTRGQICLLKFASEA